ncbi:hypothetical protein BDK89_0775 [Ilumatobacter fluminis]|uniref:Uncharacterized protein n=1 Tax=Ilumatobacter fluminis TaxID=467091 RepID=A0A4R7HW24_9ACTN|nr:hypothetical protein BDK89_0775 [Ilumatobacter fluminis]
MRPKLAVSGTRWGNGAVLPAPFGIDEVQLQAWPDHA